jgi:SAM-dependent methyltransferase
MTARTAFDPVATDYDTYRPQYPRELFDAIAQYAGPFTGRRVLDLAAGTGIATRALAAQGARVVATDLGPDMLRVLRSRSSRTPVAQARGEALPFARESFDVVTCATAWHWIDRDRRGAETFRVLRPGGALAVWWSFGGLFGDDEATEREREIYAKWRVGQRELVTPEPQVVDDTAVLPDDGFVDVEAREIQSTRTVSVADHVAHISTHSPVLALREDLPGFQADLLAAFGDRDALVEQVYCHLVLARRPG